MLEAWLSQLSHFSTESLYQFLQLVDPLHPTDPPPTTPDLVQKVEEVLRHHQEAVNEYLRLNQENSAQDQERVLRGIADRLVSSTTHCGNCGNPFFDKKCIYCMSVHDTPFLEIQHITKYSFSAHGTYFIHHSPTTGDDVTEDQELLIKCFAEGKHHHDWSACSEIYDVEHHVLLNSQPVVRGKNKSYQLRIQCNEACTLVFLLIKGPRSRDQLLSFIFPESRETRVLFRFISQQSSSSSSSLATLLPMISICPYTKTMVTLNPVVTVHCLHRECFALSSFLQYYMEQNPGWTSRPQCPICGHSFFLNEIRLDFDEIQNICMIRDTYVKSER